MTGDRPRVLGPAIDDQTRCIHYGTPLDVVAIAFACCGEFYPCHLCHAETAGHPAATWPVESRDERAVLCGVCGHRLSTADYLDASALPADSADSAGPSCPACAAPFNPGCALHAHLYFAP